MVTPYGLFLLGFLTASQQDSRTLLLAVAELPLWKVSLLVSLIPLAGFFLSGLNDRFSDFFEGKYPPFRSLITRFPPHPSGLRVRPRRPALTPPPAAFDAAG